ncbi:hypothetical protein [Klebsiella pneumoniae]|uniref:hypothetical protein n=1 Tax=Klebsiella pneumoniae TaxID=573 RepID=UPI0011593DE4|nr:hypothetical protein [Klebsiella pneumoniae]
MKKGDVVECIDAKGSEYLTNGKSYEVVAGKGDNGRFGHIRGDIGFEIISDDGEAIFQCRLDGLHGLFEVQK